jgi:1,4-alpha-glucan branching enzyme
MWDACEESRLADRILEEDPWLRPHADGLRSRLRHIRLRFASLAGGNGHLADLATAHHTFGLHRRGADWVFREWAPNATAVYLIGDFSGWQALAENALQRLTADGLWELRLAGGRLQHGDLYRLHIQWAGGQGERIPAYARRVVQDPHTLIFNAQVWEPPELHRWRHPLPEAAGALLVYEAHVGMAQEREGVGTYHEFAAHILPRIAAAGYNTIQLMAVQEHPYYGSFGYQVSNFFAPSSRFGTPEDLKALVDRAHAAGLRVVMDLVHSHAVANEVEGLSRFDGTPYQYFHDGPRGRHHAWDSRCFDYARSEVLAFLLSNCRYWLEEFHFDGFRFDGVTSMLYLDHGLGKAFTSYADYFGANVDEDAVAYLALANHLVHHLNPAAVTIAEDISGLPGLAAPLSRGGLGFDYRFAMGIADQWIRLAKDVRDEDWPMSGIWYELTNRRADEQSISYAESHDQALVGDQTLMFRLAGAAIYDHMGIHDPDLRVARAMALHNLIRLVTLATAGHGYLNFMGNEFGHPEWIDFPREGNQWSYHYARRQWRLVDDPQLKYRQLAAFDRAMLALAREHRLFEEAWPRLVFEHNEDKVLAFARAGLLFVFNFHPDRSLADYRLPYRPGAYRMIFTSDDPSFGGHARLAPLQTHFTLQDPGADQHAGGSWLSLYLPSRCALVLAPE